MRWALIKNNLVQNIIVADEAFIEKYRREAPALWDSLICIDGMDPEPRIGWTYNSGVFAEGVSDG